MSISSRPVRTANEILMTMRSERKLRSEVSMFDPIGVDREGNEISLEDVLGSTQDTVSSEVELRMSINRLYKRMKNALTDRERMVIEMRYGLVDGTILPQRKIAEILGISRSYISRIEKKALGKLYAAINS